VSTKPPASIRRRPGAVWNLHSNDDHNGYLIGEWERRSLVTVGFSEAEPVSALTRDELIDRFTALGRPGSGIQIARFRDDVDIGDLIVAPARRLGICCLAVVAGGYQWSPTPFVYVHHHARAVNWLGQLALNELPDFADRPLRHRWTLSKIPEPADDWFIQEAG
jgi:predicted Mrr-cat superfamily restriction endonuclease